MGSLWIVRRGDEERGPFTSPQLRSLANSGQLRRTDLVTKQGQNRYVPAEKVKGLFSAPSDNPSPARPPALPKAQAKSKSAEDDELDFGVVEIIEDDPKPLVLPKAPTKAKPTDDEELDFSVVEIIEDDAVVVLDEAKDDFDFFDFDKGGGDEFEEPEPPRSTGSGSSRRETRPAKGKSSAPSRRGSPPTKPAKPKKRAKDNDGEDEDEDSGPWLNVVYGLACIAGGIFLFIGLGKEDPNEWSSRRGAIVAVVRLMYNIGGKWMVLGLAILISLLFFGSAISQFRKAE
jgi:hypothetical protein